MSDTKHDELPWEQWNKDDQVIASKTGYVCRFGVPPQEILTSEDKANMAFTLTACNNHDELLAENAKLKRSLEHHGCLGGCCVCGIWDRDKPSFLE